MGFPQLQTVLNPSPVLYPHARKAAANVTAGLSPMKILVVGDSTAFGSNAAGNPVGPGGASWPSRLATALNSYFPTDIGLSTPPPGNNDTRWISAAGWTFDSLGFGFAQLGYWSGAVAASNVTYTPGTSCDTADIYYLTAPGFGTFNVKSELTGNTAVNTNAALGIGKVTVPLGSIASNHVLTFGTISVASVYIYGVDVYLTATPKIRVGNAGIPGTTALLWADSGGSFNYISRGMLRAYAPDLTLMALGGINDGNTGVPFNTYQASIQALVSDAQLSGDVLYVTAIPSLPAAAGALALEQQATSWLKSQESVISVSDVFGRWFPNQSMLNNLGYYSDNFHGTTFSYADVMAPILQTLLAILL